MRDLIKNGIAAIADFILFFILWLGFGINWMIAFFVSTAVIITIWWILTWGFGWGNYLLKR
ncbi:MAG: hypothetical protein DWQ04_22200 [Chloroflexi bacterium]|nr:MAG: hypothetical protein DWQ04_22200 [Chloroflexota bacterium]